MHESQVKCIPFNGGTPGDRNIIMFYKSTLICSLLHFPQTLGVFLRAFQKYFTVCQVAVPPFNALLYHSKGL